MRADPSRPRQRVPCNRDRWIAPTAPTPNPSSRSLLRAPRFLKTCKHRHSGRPHGEGCRWSSRESCSCRATPVGPASVATLREDQPSADRASRWPEERHYGYERTRLDDRSSPRAATTPDGGGSATPASGRNAELNGCRRSRPKVHNGSVQPGRPRPVSAVAACLLAAICKRSGCMQHRGEVRSFGPGRRARIRRTGGLSPSRPGVSLLASRRYRAAGATSLIAFNWRP
jgi:hypothetical protein